MKRAKNTKLTWEKSLHKTNYLKNCFWRWHPTQIKRLPRKCLQSLWLRQGFEIRTSFPFRVQLSRKTQLEENTKLRNVHISNQCRSHLEYCTRSDRLVPNVIAHAKHHTSNKGGVFVKQFLNSARRWTEEKAHERHILKKNMFPCRVL